MSTSARPATIHDLYVRRNMVRLRSARSLKNDATILQRGAPSSGTLTC
jgi:hypothetical protein